MSTTNNTSQNTTQKKKEAEKTEKKPVPQLGPLDEDDEFEEFPAEDWNENEEDAEDTHLWEDNWDDDDVEDDFSVQLRNELSKQAQPQPMTE
jgi:26 proteasome complex subunit DSS1